MEDDSRLKQVLCGTSAYEEVEGTFFRNERSLLKGTGAWLDAEPPLQRMDAESVRDPLDLRRAGVGEKLPVHEHHQAADGGARPGEPEPRGGVLLRQGEQRKSPRRQRHPEDAGMADRAPGRGLQEPRRRRLPPALPHRHAAELTWENLFLRYYASDGRGDNTVTMVVDGLDEATADARRVILGFVRDLASPRAARRPAMQLAGDRTWLAAERSGLPPAGQHLLHRGVAAQEPEGHGRLHREAASEELDILHEIRQAEAQRAEAREQEGGKIMRKVSDGADGVFLWAKLLLDDLVKKICRRSRLSWRAPGEPGRGDLVRSLTGSPRTTRSTRTC